MSDISLSQKRHLRPYPNPYHDPDQPHDQYLPHDPNPYREHNPNPYREHDPNPYHSNLALKLYQNPLTDAVAHTPPPRPAHESKPEVKITDEEFDQFLKGIGFGEEPEAETIRELSSPVTSDQLTEAEINRVINLLTMPHNDLPSFVFSKEKRIFKVYVADLVEDYVLRKDLFKYLVSMEPRVSELVESEIVNGGQKFSTVIRAFVECVRYSIEDVYGEKNLVL